MKQLIYLSIAVLMSCHCSRPQGKDVAIASDSIPACLNILIEQFKKEEKQNPPRQIFSYQYNGKTVYYVTPPCCDFFSDLYNTDCVLIGHPDGGFTGRGDGKTPDFVKARTNEKLIWKDERD